MIRININIAIVAMVGKPVGGVNQLTGECKNGSAGTTFERTLNNSTDYVSLQNKTDINQVNFDIHPHTFHN